MCSRSCPILENPLATQICYHEALKQFWGIYFLTKTNGSSLKLWQKSVKIPDILKKLHDMVNRHNKSDFWMQKNFWFRPFFDLFSHIMDQKNGRSQKSC